jgi:hypothetical protein
MSERWRLEVDYFRLNRHASKVLDTDVTWGDLPPIAAGTTVNSVYNFYDARMSVGYTFFKRRDKELGIGLGLHVAGIKTSLEAGALGAEAVDVLAPLPVMNLYGRFANRPMAVRLRMDWLSLTYGDYSGDVRNTAIDVLYQPFRHVGFGLGIRNLVLDLKIDNPDWVGRARSVYTGPAAFMTVSF